MGGENDGVIAAEVTDQVADLDDLLGVKTDRRLVENDDLGVADERLRDADSLAVALGQIANDAVVNVLDLNDLANLRQMLLAIQRTALELVVEVEIFLDGHVQVQGGLLGQIADELFGAQRVGEDVDACDGGLARGGGQVTRENVHGGGFACAVGAEQAYDLTAFYGKADVVDRAEGAVIFDQMFDLYHGFAGILSMFCQKRRQTG